MRLDEPIVVVGAGIGGLTTALCLEQAGFSVQVMERAERLDPIGAGIQLSPNALRVLGLLGVLPRVERLGTVAERVRLRDGRTGRTIAEVPVTASDGTGYIAIHRGDLQAALLETVEARPSIRLTLGHALTGVNLRQSGVRLSFQTGPGPTATIETPLAVAADGVSSATAAALGLSPAVPSGMAARRWIAPASATGEHPMGIEAWLGPRRHAVAYPVASGTAVNIVVIAPIASDAIEGRDLLSGWDPGLTGLIDAAEPAGVWALSTTPADRPLCVGGSLAFVGDAGHAMLPYAAQGGAMAIEDAWVLAGRLASGLSTGAALLAYEGERRPRLQRVRSRVAFHRKVYHLPRPFSLARDAVLAMRPASALQRDLAWLYDWKPEAGSPLTAN